MMRKPLFLLFLFVPFLASAQFSVSVMPRLVTTHSYENSRYFSNDLETENRSSFGVDVLGTYSFKFGLSLSTGIEYTSYKWRWIEKYDNYMENSSTPFYSPNLKHNQEITSFSIPIYANFGYTIGKFSPYAGGGVLIGVANEYSIQFENGAKYNDDGIKNSMFVAFRLGCNYELSDRFFVGVGANYRAMKGRVSTFMDSKIKLSSLAVGVTLGYKF